MTNLIGPGPSCWYCGETYGGHQPKCKEAEKQRKLTKQRRKLLGERLLSAIDARDTEALGKWIEETVR